MENKLSLGLRTIITIFNLLAFLFIGGGVSILVMGVPLGEIKLFSAVIFAVVSLSLGVWFAIVARWISKLTRLITTVITLVIILLWGCFSGISGLFRKEIGVAIFNMFFLIIFGGCLYYLTRPKVKEQFK
jgi:hypothetical protein